METVLEANEMGKQKTRIKCPICGYVWDFTGLGVKSKCSRCYSNLWVFDCLTDEPLTPGSRGAIREARLVAIEKKYGTPKVAGDE